MDWWWLLRIICLVGCCFCGLLLSSARFRQWNTWSIKTQDHWWALGGWVFFGAYAVVENIIQGNAGGSRLVVLALVIAFTLRALLRPGELKAQAVHSRKKDSS